MRGGYDLAGFGAVVPPPSVLIPLYIIVSRWRGGHGRTGSGTPGPPHTPRCNGILSSDCGAVDMALRGLVMLCPLPPLDTAEFAPFDGGGEVRWCPPHSRSILLYSTIGFDGEVESMIIRGLVL